MTLPPDNNKFDDFQAMQYAFTRHIRNPEKYPAPPDLETRRINIYRRLIYNNIENFIADSFPVLRSIIPDEHWHNILHDYVSNHQSYTPLFHRMPQEFLRYLEQEKRSQVEDPPFMLELAYYEWLETAVSLDTCEISLDRVDTAGDLLSDIPVINPTMVPRSYRYPVHQIKPDFLPEQEPENPTHLVVYRKSNDKVAFLELNTVSARLVELIQNNIAETGQQLLENIAQELQHPDPQIVVEGGFETMRDMHAKNLLLGTKQLA